VGHLRTSGFTVKDESVGDLAPIKAKYKVPSALESCHTALVEGYVVEGHVPGDTIKRLLRERPTVVGLAVPGMPVGAPGMDEPGQPPQSYQVFTFDRTGKTAVFERH
jgi:hypothetical protein